MRRDKYVKKETYMEAENTWEMRKFFQALVSCMQKRGETFRSRRPSVDMAPLIIIHIE
jgi:hypothetical protein